LNNSRRLARHPVSAIYPLQMAANYIALLEL
jgi:hypothetical protein